MADPLKLVLFFMAVILLWTTVYTSVLLYKNSSSAGMSSFQWTVFVIGRIGRVLAAVVVMFWAFTNNLLDIPLLVSIALIVLSPVLFLLGRLFHTSGPP